MQNQPRRRGPKPLPAERRRSACVSALVTPAEYDRLCLAADAAEQSLSDLIRTAALAALPELADTAA